MARIEPMLVSCTPAVPRSWRLFFVVFLVKIWRLNACERLTLPEPRTLKRLAAPLLVFILGITNSVVYLTSRRVVPAERFNNPITLRLLQLHLLFLWPHDHHQLAAFHFGELLHGAMGG